MALYLFVHNTNIYTIMMMSLLQAESELARVTKELKSTLHLEGTSPLTRGRTVKRVLEARQLLLKRSTELKDVLAAEVAAKTDSGRIAGLKAFVLAKTAELEILSSGKTMYLPPLFTPLDPAAVPQKGSDDRLKELQDALAVATAELASALAQAEFVVTTELKRRAAKSRQKKITMTYAAAYATTLGLSYVFAFIVMARDEAVWSYLFALSAASQGCLILYQNVYRSTEVKNQLRKALFGKKRKKLNLTRAKKPRSGNQETPVQLRSLATGATSTVGRAPETQNLWHDSTEQAATDGTVNSLATSGGMSYIDIGGNSSSYLSRASVSSITSTRLDGGRGSFSPPQSQRGPTIATHPPDQERRSSGFGILQAHRFCVFDLFEPSAAGLDQVQQPVRTQLSTQPSPDQPRRLSSAGAMATHRNHPMSHLLMDSQNRGARSFMQESEPFGAFHLLEPSTEGSEPVQQSVGAQFSTQSFGGEEVVVDVIHVPRLGSSSSRVKRTSSAGVSRQTSIV